MGDTHDLSEQEQQAFSRLMMTMMRHPGRAKAIGMGELYEEIYGEPWQHRINDTRKLRKLITFARRRHGLPICSSASPGGGGYWLASVDTELEDYTKRMTAKAVKLLSQVSVMKKMSMPELLGQLKLSFSGETNG